MNNNNVNILIIDDNDGNITSVREVLKSTFGFKNENLFPQESDIKSFANKVEEFASNNCQYEFREFAKKYILDNDIDLLMLDFALSEDEAKVSKDNKDVTLTTGYSLLDELTNTNNKLLKRLPIIAFTFLPLEQLNKEQGARCIGTLNKVSRSKQDLTTELIRDMKNNTNSIIYSILYHGNIYKETKTSQYDLAILCALEEEFDEILKLPNKWKNLGTDDNNVDVNGWKLIKEKGENYLTTIFEDKNKNEIKVVAKCMKDMGMVESATFTTRIINIFKPQYFVMTGIAAGIEDDGIKLGDILIPNIIWNWQSGKFTTMEDLVFDETKNTYKKEIQTYFHEDMRQKTLDPELSEIVNELKRDDTFFKKMVMDFDDNNVNKIPNIITEKMVSGSAVVANNKIINDIKKRKLVGLDMEAYGVFYAAEKAKLYSNTKAIVIKSICDFANEEKDDSYHHFASHASARTMYKLFTEYVF
jgi:nucleoside phosphorylase